MKTRRIFLMLLLCFAVMVLLSSCVGSYFVNFALARQDFDAEKLNQEDMAFQFSEEARYDDTLTGEQKALVEDIISIASLAEQWTSESELQKWEMKTTDGLRLVANYYPNPEPSHKYVILVHGYTSRKEDMLSYGSMFREWGYNILAADNRSHGESEGNYIGMGWLDSYDQLLWINRIVEMDPEAQITMLGVSMGGATVMMTSGLDLPSNVKCLIEDCGYSSVWEQFRIELKDIFHLPSWPVLNIADNASRRIAGYSIKEASSLDRLAKCKVPMLFIHGTEDTFVMYDMLDDNIAAIGDTEHEVLRVEGAGHGASLYRNYELYTSTVRNFVDKYIK